MPQFVSRPFSSQAHLQLIAINAEMIDRANPQYFR
jgi:hypothetical protein